MRVDQLWRYPVKSVGGERLTAATVGVLGIEGDRGIAIHDEREEVTRSAPVIWRIRRNGSGTHASRRLGDGVRPPGRGGVRRRR